MTWIDTTATTTVEPSVSYDILVVKGLEELSKEDNSYLLDEYSDLDKDSLDSWLYKSYSSCSLWEPCAKNSQVVTTTINEEWDETIPF